MIKIAFSPGDDNGGSGDPRIHFFKDNNWYFTIFTRTKTIEVNDRSYSDCRELEGTYRGKKYLISKYIPV